MTGHLTYCLNIHPTETWDELRAALTELKEAPESAASHRRVGHALEALGRKEAAQKEFKNADELESTVDDQD